MALVLSVNGVDVTTKLMESSLSIDSQLNSVQTAGFTLVEKGTEPTSALVTIGNEVTISLDGSPVFGGNAKIVKTKQPNNALVWFHTVEAYGYIDHLNNHLVAEVYENQFSGDIIKDLVTNYLSGEGYTTTNVNDGLVISKAVFNYQSFAAAANELSDLTGFDFYIDHSKNIYFKARDENLAPFSVTDSNHNGARDIEVINSYENYRNRQYVRAGRDITETQSENFSGDGQRITFTALYPLAEVPTITVDTGGGAASQTVGILGLDTGKDWYWSKDEKQISQDEGGTVLATSHIMAISYKGFFPLIVIAEDTAEIAERATIENTDGVVESVIDDQNIEKLDNAVEKAQGLLRKFGKITETINFNSDTAGLLPGQLITIEIAGYQVSGDYLIENINIQDIPGLGFRYSVKALSGESFGGWVDFFKKLADNGRKFVIRENEILTRMRVFSEQIDLTDSLVTSSAAISCEIGTAEISYSEVCL